MKTNLFRLGFLSFFVTAAFAFPNLSFSQVAEWRLVTKTYNPVDPDGAGPATGSVQFDLEMRAASGTIQAREIQVGYSYQSSKAMVPQVNGACPPTGTPTNISVSPEFTAGGYTYTFVNQCNDLVTVAGGQTFNKTASGSLDQGGGQGITLTTTWVPALTITLYTLSNTQPEGGYAMVHSTGTGPGRLGTYSMANSAGDEVTVNSMSFDNPIQLGSSAVLPITLSNFGITCTGNGALLNWKTLNEQNSRNFEIERSSNGASNWTLIGSTNAAGNSTAAKQYEYYDLKGGTAYYRLRQVDKDGRFTYSSVQRVNCESQLSSILLYPNPAKNTLNVVLATERDARVTLALYDISGKAMRQVSTQLMKGNNNIKLNIAGLSSGEYILKVIGSEVFKTQKVTVIN